jgi:hypothetical protein
MSNVNITDEEIQAAPLNQLLAWWRNEHKWADDERAIYRNIHADNARRVDEELNRRVSPLQRFTLSDVDVLILPGTPIDDALMDLLALSELAEEIPYARSALEDIIETIASDLSLARELRDGSSPDLEKGPF